MSYNNSEQKKELGAPVPGYSDDLGDRISAVISLIGTLKDAARIVGVTDEQIGRWKTGKSKATFTGLAALAKAAGVSMDWLATGEGEQQAVVDPVDTRLAEIEYNLNQASVPMSEDDLRSAPKWAEIRDELRLIAKDEKVGNAQRGRADLILRLAFSDKEAARRASLRYAEVSEKMRRSRKVFEATLQAVEWDPPIIVREALRTTVYTYDMKVEDAAYLLEAIQSAVEGRD